LADAITTAFEDMAMLFRDLIKENICHSYKRDINTFHITKILNFYRMKNGSNV